MNLYQILYIRMIQKWKKVIRNFYWTRMIDVSFVSFRMQFPYSIDKRCYGLGNTRLFIKREAFNGQKQKSLKSYDFRFTFWYGFLSSKFLFHIDMTTKHWITLKRRITYKQFIRLKIPLRNFSLITFWEDFQVRNSTRSSRTPLRVKQ